eukprot:TRINITY_DN16677_c0_g1_i1.p1 TRINITY_DN16677_c0_g1~~TRINITY_DN16677_c0_g1_i1.p1  ORF type:complete len:145 (+),score=13.32 TRINITY_DN16677_c0_g1_i1:14-448(+)
MYYIHSQNVVHRDLKSQNILVGRNWTIKVADFGLSILKQEYNKEHEFCCTVHYRAPEVTMSTFLQASDVFSYSIILWELITREKPWEGLDRMAILNRVKLGERLVIPACPAFYRNLICRSWAQDPEKRPTFKEIVEILEEISKI